MRNYKGSREPFVGGFGPQDKAKNLSNAVDIFQLFFDEEFIHTIVLETNRYAEQQTSSGDPTFSKRSRITAWKPVTEQEIYVTL